MPGIDPKTAYKMAAGLTVLSLFLSGCSALDSSQLPMSRGQIAGVDPAALHNTGYSDIFYYQSALQPQVIEARKNYGDDQVNRELRENMENSLRVRISRQSGPVEASLSQAAMSADDISQVRVPYQLNLTSRGDGGYAVEITGQECNTGVVPEVCSQPVTAVVEGFFDVNAPQIGLQPFQAMINERGELFATGQISDGQASSGITQARAVSCDGQNVFPLGIDAQGRFNMLVPLKPGQTCFFSEATDAAGNTGRSGQQIFSYSLAVTPQLVQAPDGRLQVVGSAASSIQSPLQIKLESCDTQTCIPVEGQDTITPDQNGSFASQPLPVRPGLNRFMTRLFDRWGNPAQSEVSFEYAFSLSAKSGLNTDGTITVTALPQNNLLPSFNVGIQQCNNPSTQVAGVRNPDGQFTASFVPQVGENCLEAVAQDASGNVVSAQTKTSYSFGPGEVHQRVEYRDNGAGLYLYGNSSETVDPATVTASGTQRDWQDFQREKGIACTNLGSLNIDGAQWKYALYCDLPANAGDATVRLEMFDKFGHQFSAYYPANAQLLGDLRDKPSSKEMLDFLTPMIISLTLAGAAAGTTGVAGFKKLEKRAKRQRAREFGTMLGNNERVREFVERKRHVVAISQKEVVLYHQMNEAWSFAQKGDFRSAMGIISGMDLGANPNLQEVRRVILNGMVDMALTRIGGLNKAGDESRLELRAATNLTSAMAEMIRSPFGAQVDGLKGQTLMRDISALQIVKQAYSMSPHDFMDRHVRIWRGKSASDREALSRMIDLLLHWRNYRIAHELIRYTEGVARQKYTALYEKGMREIKLKFAESISAARDEELRVHKGARPIHVQNFTRGMRLPDDAETDLLTLSQIEYGVRTGEHRLAFSSIRSYAKAHPDEISGLIPALRETVQGISDELRQIVGEKSIKRFADGSLLALVTALSQSLDEPWLAGITPQVRQRLTAQVGELLTVGLAQAESFEVFARFIGPIHMQTAVQTEVLMRTLCSWNDYATAKLCISHYPVEADRKRMHTAYKKEYEDTLVASLANEVRKNGVRAQVYLSGYRLPGDLQELCSAVSDIETDVRNNLHLNALRKTRAYLKIHPERLPAIGMTVEASLAKADGALAKIAQSKQRAQLKDISILQEAEELMGMSDESWWKDVRYGRKDMFLADARRIMIVAAAQNYPYEEFERRFRARYMKSAQQRTAVIAVLSEWKDLKTAQTCISRHPDARERAQLQGDFDRSWILPLRTQFGVAARSGASFVSFFSGFSVPPYMEAEGRKVEEMAMAEKKGDMSTLMTEIRAFVNGNPEGLVMIRPMLDAALITIGGEWSKIISEKDRLRLRDSSFQHLRKSVVEMSREPWWQNGFQSTDKSRVMQLAQQMDLMAIVESGQFDLIRARFEGITDPEVMEQTANGIVRWGNIAVLDQVSSRMAATPDNSAARGELGRVIKDACYRVEEEVSGALFGGSRERAVQLIGAYSLPTVLQRKLEQSIRVDEAMQKPIETVRQVCLVNMGSLKEQYDGKINGILEKRDAAVWKILYGLTPRQAEVYLLASVVAAIAEKSLVLGARQFEFRDGSAHVRVSNGVDIRKLQRQFHPDVARSKYAAVVKDPAVLAAIVYFYDEFAFKKIQDLVPVDETAIDYNLIEEIEEFALTKPRMDIIIGLIRLIDPDLRSIKGLSIFDTLCSTLEKSML